MSRSAVVYLLIASVSVLSQTAWTGCETRDTNSTVETCSMTVEQARQPTQIPMAMRIQAAIVNGQPISASGPASHGAAAAFAYVPKEPNTDGDGNIVKPLPTTPAEIVGAAIQGIGNLIRVIGGAAPPPAPPAPPEKVPAPKPDPQPK